MFLSIIVPVYNGSAFLDEALERLIPLLVDDNEVIVIDDGSTDNSFSICRDYDQRHERMTAVRQDNAGPSAARNLGLRMARGEYVVFFDADDVIDTKAFLCLLEHIRNRNDVNVWCTDFYRVDPLGRICDRISQIPEQAEPIIGKENLPRFLGAPDRYWNIWRYVFKRSFLLDNDLFFLESYNCAEDLEYMTRVFLLDGQFAFFHVPYYYYIVEQEGTLTGWYDIRRITQLLDMLSRAKAETDGACGWPGANEMARKIQQEYVMCLALICQMPPEQRREARIAFRDRLSILNASGGPVPVAIVAACRAFGIGLVSRLLYWVKCLRRVCRQATRRMKHETAPAAVTDVLARRRQSCAVR